MAVDFSVNSVLVCTSVAVNPSTAATNAFQSTDLTRTPSYFQFDQPVASSYPRTIVYSTASMTRTPAGRSCCISCQTRSRMAG